jgi:ABC-type Na+ transport system ATPase subunit NatA
MTPVIEARASTKRFKDVVALDGLDLSAPSGSITAILGPNGAGKSTFVRAVATLLRLDGGQLRVAGHDVAREPAAVRRIIGLAGQSAAVEPAMTGRENLHMVARLYGQDRRKARVSAASLLEQLHLTDAGDRKVRTYSGGMRRRLDLGVSLVAEPRLLLLDEPTTGLDPRSRIELWELVRGLVARGTDVLLTTQYQPLTVMIDAVRALTLGSVGDPLLDSPTGSYVARSLAWAVALLAVAIPLSLARFTRRWCAPEPPVRKRPPTSSRAPRGASPLPRPQRRCPPVGTPDTGSDPPCTTTSDREPSRASASPASVDEGSRSSPACS